MTIVFNPKDWYWSIEGDDGRVYSSARNIYVPIGDAAYTQWKVITGMPQAVSLFSETDIWFYMKDVLPAWLYDGTTFSQPGLDQYTQPQLIAYSNNARWVKEQGGMTLSTGNPIATDDRAQAKINGAKLMALDKTTTYNPYWHFADGSIQQINATAVIAMSNELQAFIEGLFTASASMIDQITAGTITSLAQIDAAYQ